MSRYLLLLILNAPFIILGILSSLVSLKMNKISRRRFSVQLLFWLIIVLGLISAQPLYEWLFSHSLTVSEPLSVFDVIQITAIVILFYISNRSMAKLSVLEKRVQDLHQELSIIVSKNDTTQ